MAVRKGPLLGALVGLLLLFGSHTRWSSAAEDFVSQVVSLWTSSLQQQSKPLTSASSFQAPPLPPAATAHGAGLVNRRPRRPDHFFRRFTCARNFEAVDSNTTRRCFLKSDDPGLPRHWIRVPGNGGAFLDSWGFVAGYLWWGHIGLWVSDRAQAEAITCPSFTTKENKNGVTICTVRSQLPALPITHVSHNTGLSRGRGPL
jgi:hypothetical protein